MSINKIISNILLLIIGIIFVYVIFKIFVVEGFDQTTQGNSETLNVQPANGTSINQINYPLLFNNLNKGINNLDTKISNVDSNINTIDTNINTIDTNIYNGTRGIQYKLNDMSDNLFSDYDASSALYDVSGNMLSQILTKINDLTLKIDTRNSIKCVADFGTDIGEPLSNGKGVLTDTKYICPQELPNCSGLLCGQKYGVCIS